MRDLVAIDLPGGPAFVAALRGAWDSGDAVLPLDQRLSKTAQRAVLEQLRPARVIGPDGDQHRSDGVPVEAGDALVMATSGTTGTAKGVILTHRAVLASAQATSRRLGVDPGEHTWLACLPLNHVGGLAVVTRSLLTGTPLVVLPGFDRERVRAAGGPHVLVSLVPTALARVGAEHFRTVVLGGSAPPGSLPPNVIPTYGLTETGSGVVYGGTPLPGVEVAIAPDTAEIFLRGPMLLRGYRDGTAALTAAGWLATGDAGGLDADGHLQIHGRLTEVIISGGENIWPAPVEAALLTHPSVAEVAVAGTPDPEWGQRVVAWVVPADAAALPVLEELRRLVAESVAPFAAPRQVVLVDQLPRTSIGKVQRALLPPAVGAPPMAIDHYTRDDLAFEVSEAGPANGRAVILLHGFPEDRYCWESLAGSLADAGYRTLASDQRGYSPGARPAGRRPYALDQLAGDVLALADAAGADRFDVVGHDWGAAVAWFLAAAHPERIRSLTALSVPHPRALAEALTRSTQPLRSWYMLFFQIPILPERALSWSGGSRLVGQLQRIGLDGDSARRYARRAATPGDLTGPLNWYRALPFDLRSRGGPITVPTLFVWGERDRFVTGVAASRCGRHVTGPFTSVSLAEADHWLPSSWAHLVAPPLLRHLADAADRGPVGPPGPDA